jgi:hypothetical protein
MVKERVLIENMEQRERIEDLTRYLALESETADVYRRAMDLTSARNESLEADMALLENFIDMAAKDGEADMKTSERTAKLFRDYVNRNIENNNKKIKMENSVCVNG